MNANNPNPNLDSLVSDVNKLLIKEHSLTDFQRNVYAYTKTIPKGQVSTYKNIAIAMGCPGSSRAVGTALSKNPFAPLVPCHRVIASDGKIGGFMGKTGKCVQTERKIAMLQAEGIIIENSGRLSRAPGYWDRVVIIPLQTVTQKNLTDLSLAQIIT
jgi:methylated-DNA-[protein]-cysteine S-methyltransferase